MSKHLETSGVSESRLKMRGVLFSGGISAAFSNLLLWFGAFEFGHLGVHTPLPQWHKYHSCPPYDMVYAMGVEALDEGCGGLSTPLY